MAQRHDPCVRYTLMVAQHFLQSGETISWWKFTEQGKKLLAEEAERKATLLNRVSKLSS
jgi:hypothetical protein